MKTIPNESYENVANSIGNSMVLKPFLHDNEKQSYIERIARRRLRRQFCKSPRQPLCVARAALAPHDAAAVFDASIPLRSLLSFSIAMTRRSRAVPRKMRAHRPDLRPRASPAPRTVQ